MESCTSQVQVPQESDKGSTDYTKLTSVDQRVGSGKAILLLLDSCMHVGEVERTSLVQIPAYMQEIVSATKFLDTTLTAKILADITECCRHVRPTFATCWRQTKMSVLWVVEPTDTTPNIASQGNGSLYCNGGGGEVFNSLKQDYWKQNLFMFDKLVQTLDKLLLLTFHPTVAKDFLDYSKLLDMYWPLTA